MCLTDRFEPGPEARDMSLDVADETGSTGSVANAEAYDPEE